MKNSDLTSTEKIYVPVGRFLYDLDVTHFEVSAVRLSNVVASSKILVEVWRYGQYFHREKMSLERAEALISYWDLVEWKT